MINERILNIDNPEDAEILRKKAAPFDFRKYTKKERDELIKRMRKIMDNSGGIGLAANQIGLDMSVFVAKADNKFYCVFNPRITKASDNIVPWDGEGCLSVANKFSRTYRSDKIELEGEDKNGKKIKIKAWGLLSLIIQHEVDHLNGKLFLDRIKHKA